jgi:hypothetical protein
MAKMVGHVVATLQKRLQTFKIEYKPGPKSHLMGIAREHDPIHHVGGICSHRDFNKAACPGKMIPESYYLEVIKAAM